MIRTMKKTLFIILTMLIALPSFAQQKPKDKDGRDVHRQDNKIENIVKDLSATQKTRIDLVTRQSKKKVDAYRKQLQAVRDSIHTLMDSQQDNSEPLFRLYEREGHLQAEISKEYYRAKRAIDDVLTPEQYKTLRENSKEPKPHKPRPDDDEFGPRPKDFGAPPHDRKLPPKLQKD